MLGQLIEAASQGRAAEVAALLDSDPSLANQSTMLGARAIHAAHFAGQDEVVRLLFDRGVTLDGFLAAELGMLERLEQELAADAQFPRRVGGQGQTALHLACYWTQLEAARLLLDHGADVAAATSDGFLDIAPLGCAVAAPDIPSPGDREEAVLALVRLLLERGAAVNHRRRDGLTALHSAAYRGHLSVMKLLLDRGADPSITGRDGMGPHAGHTARDVAQAQGQQQAVELLESL